MPTPSRALTDDPLTGVPLSRRAALATVAAVAGAALAGCTPERQRRRGEDPPGPVEPRVDPDVLVAAEALGNQQQILDLLDATQQRHPRLTRQLAPVVAAHEAHAALLAEAVPADVSATPSTSPAPSPDGSATVPRKRRQALARVVAAERELATATKRHAFRAQSGAFARLLGSMAAAAAQHEAVLSTAERRRAS